MFGASKTIFIKPRLSFVSVHAKFLNKSSLKEFFFEDINTYNILSAKKDKIRNQFLHSHYTTKKFLAKNSG